MNKFLPKHIAEYGILLILSLIVIFHLLILSGIIPFEIVWGGRLKTASEMFVFEAISILVNLLMIAVVWLQSDLTRFKINRPWGKVALWLMAVLFLLNTLGNVFSKNETEALVFTPLTFILAVLSLRLAVD